MKDSLLKKKDYKICDELKYDVRLIKRNVDNDFITDEQLNSHLQALKDESSKAVEIDFSEDGSAEGKGLTFL